MKNHLLEKSRKISADIISMNSNDVLYKDFNLVKATTTGLILRKKNPPAYVFKEELLKFLNEPVELFLSQFEYSFYGHIQSITKFSGKSIQLEVCFMDSVPGYYRECVQDLLN